MSDEATLGRQLTLSRWCDQTCGTQIVRQVNDQLVRWCEAFLDEGHATWPMPERERGLYGAWKAVASHEWSPCGIADSKRKIARLSANPEDTLLDSLDSLGIPPALRQDYLSAELTALPGWAGFIKWRAEEHHYPWQQLTRRPRQLPGHSPLVYPRAGAQGLPRGTGYRRHLCRRDGLFEDPVRRVLPAPATRRRPSSGTLRRSSRSPSASEGHGLEPAARALPNGGGSPAGGRLQTWRGAQTDRTVEGVGDGS